MINSSKRVVSGTHRAATLESTLAVLKPRLRDFGITRVANITGLDDVGIPTVVVTRPNARSLSVSQGKGLSLTAAKVSGIMESVEQFCAEHVQLPLTLASYHQRRKRAQVIEVERLPRSLRPFDGDAKMLWVSAQRWGSAGRAEEKVEVPFELVHLDLTPPLPPGSGMFPVSSNGLASGNTLAEAVAHGAWELIERDATTLFYQRPRSQASRRLRLESIDDPSARKLLDAYAEADVSVEVWDITTGLQIPAFLCNIIERQLNPFRRVGLARGYGCHADRGVALCRALCEAAQSRLTRISGSRDDLQHDEVEEARDPETIQRHQARINAPLGQWDFTRVPSCHHPSFEEDLSWTQAKLADAGLGDIYVVDLAASHNLPLAVVRVMIPGLEGAPTDGVVPGERARRAKESDVQ